MSTSEVVSRAILLARSDAIVAADRKGIITFWNPGAERIFGYESEFAIGRSLDIIIPEQIRARHWDGYHRVMETGKTRYGDGDVLAVPAIRDDGKRISIEFTILILHSTSGDPDGFAAIIRDVTVRFNELKALKKRLEQNLPPAVDSTK